MTEQQATSAVGTRNKSAHQWLRRTIFVAGGLILCEILLRVIFGFGNPVLIMRDPDCGYRFKPNQHIYRFFSHNDINEYGMRSPEIFSLRPKDSLRFFFIGDSITYGTTYVDQSEILTSRLVPLLSTVEHRPVEVLNQSAGGWAPSNEVHYLLANGTFDSNVVVFVLNTGDLGQQFVNFPEGDLNFPTSRPWTAIGEIIHRYVIPRIKGQMFHDFGTTVVDSPEAGFINLQLLAQAREFARLSHALFAIVYVPFAGFPKGAIEGVEMTLVQWTTEQHIPFIDTTGALAREDWKLTTVDGLHLNPHGDEIVAGEIARQWPIIDAALGASGVKNGGENSSK